MKCNFEYSNTAQNIKYQVKSSCYVHKSHHIKCLGDKIFMEVWPEGRDSSFHEYE